MADLRAASIDMYLHPCHRACRHCFASQGPRVGGLMTLEQFRRYTAAFQQAASDSGPVFATWGVTPFADGLHHPDIAAMVEHLESLGNTSFRGFSSDCWRIARDPDWEALVDTLYARQSRFVQITMYGTARVHDWFARKEGSFAATELAVDRLAGKGFRIGWVVILHQQNVGEIDELLTWIARKTPGARPEIMTIWPVGRSMRDLDLLIGEQDLAALSSDARGYLRDDLRTEGQWREQVARGQFPTRAGHYAKLKQFLLLSVLHDGSVRGGERNQFALGHLDTDDLRTLVARHDAVIVPGWDKQAKRGDDVVAQVGKIPPSPELAGKVLTARYQLAVWERRRDGTANPSS